jgi:hypothetical protein
MVATQDDRVIAENRLQRIVQLEEELRQTRQQLEDALQREEMLRFHWRWRWRQRLRRLIGVRLGVMRQYRPRPLAIPEHYSRTQSTGEMSIALVTPSYNQAPFLERTIQSVLGQQFPRLEYVVQDGGSSDETCAILDRYRSRLTHCESAKDRGQGHAINLGFRHTRAEIMAYLNSDDLLLPGALHYVADYFAKHPEVDVVYGHRIVVDEEDAEIGRWVLPKHNDDVLSWADYIPQETLFWRRSIWERAGGEIDESFQFALDWDLILRFRACGARFVRLPRFLGIFRYHQEQKTCSQLAGVGAREMDRLRTRCHGRRVSSTEIARHLLSYFWRHVLYHKLYQLGILRY